MEHFRARSVRAWRDFREFADKQGVQVATVIIGAVMAYYLRPSSPELVHTLQVGLTTVVGLLVLMFVVCFFLAPGRLWNEQKARISELEAQLATKKGSATTDEWKKMAKEFESLRHAPVFVKWDRIDNGPVRWRVAHYSRDASLTFTATARLAGRLVKRSRYCRRYLPDSAMNENDDESRWYETVKHLDRPVSHTTFFPDPDTNTPSEAGELEDIQRVSATLCIHLASQEEE